MEKVYRLLTWLDIGQAVDWLQDLTTTDLTGRDLLALCASRHCSVYTSADGIAGYGYGYAAEVVGQGIQRVCNPLALIRAGTETTAELTFEGPVLLDDEDLDTGEDLGTGEDGVWAVWWAIAPLRGRRALFRPGDIQALADAMNGAGMDEGRTELEDLRQQLKQERAARQVAEPSPKSRNAYLRTIAALGYALIGGGSGQPHPDADAILVALGAKGIAAPVGPKTLADYLKQAADT